jgi:Spy/CpxP family protein refolding chaperone
MKFNIAALLLLTLAFCWRASTALGQATVETPDRPDAEIAGANVELPPFPDALRDLIEEFKAQRQDILAARLALVEALKNATEEERRTLIAQFREEQRDRIAAEKELRKEIRRRLQELRRQRRGDGSNSGKGPKGST